MWGKAPRWKDPAGSGSVSVGESQDDVLLGSPTARFDEGSGSGGGSDDDIVMLGSPSGSPTRPAFLATPSSAERIAPPRVGGLHRALRELSALRRDRAGDGDHDAASPAAAAMEGRQKRLASLTAADDPGPQAGGRSSHQQEASTSICSDEAYEMDDFEIEQDSSTSAEFDDSTLRRVASVQTASPGSAGSPASADWVEDIEEDVVERCAMQLAEYPRCSSSADLI